MKRPVASLWAAVNLATVALCPVSFATESPGAVRFRETVQPILETHCYGCHGNGASEGHRTLDDEGLLVVGLVVMLALWWIIAICGLPFWQYALGFALAPTAITFIRSFAGRLGGVIARTLTGRRR